MTSIFENAFRSNRVAPQGLAAYTRMKIADWLDVVAWRHLIRAAPSDLKLRELRISGRGSLSTHSGE
jgi:hypothetical protein